MTAQSLDFIILHAVLAPLAPCHRAGISMRDAFTAALANKYRNTMDRRVIAALRAAL